MQDYEKLGVFYLGRQLDRERRGPTDDLLLYEARDLTTHAVIVGMTGSGKSGLGVALLEEAAIDSIPAIVIDPKGDLGNLLLGFPELRPDDFRPWLDEAEAQRKGVSLEQLAAKTADVWRAGLSASGQDGARIRRFRESVDLAIYTPGSSAGLPLSLLRSFQAPPLAVRSDPEALGDRVSGIASGLLSLVGVEVDPLRSREHILLANILDRAFREGRDLDLAEIIRQVHKPPFDHLGVLDLESFFPAADRFGLAMSFNNLLASPGFAAWTEGEPLEIGRLLWTPAGRPRLSVLSLAHLSDAQRMFFVSVLLDEVIGWMRKQSGTGSLRAILYMDEIAGYFPPTAMPPSKRPMLTLLKQARAFGLGVVLATQNPVDLDYKGLSNAGTWFIGRLQTERDKLRVLDGLEGASMVAGHAFSRADIDRVLSGLPSRTFLMNDVHRGEPQLFESRFALNYLRGPLTREQIRQLMESKRQGAEATSPSTAAAGSEASAAGATAPTGASAPRGSGRPVLAPEVSEFFLAPRDPAVGGAVTYRPAVFASARLHFVNAKVGVDTWAPHSLLAPFAEGDAAVDWERASAMGDEPPALERQPLEGSRFAPLPAAAARRPTWEALRRSFASWLYQGRTLTVWRCTELKATSKPGESEREFRLRLGQAARERRDASLAELKKRYAPKLAALEEKRRRAEERVAREKAQLSQQGVDTALSVGTTLLGALLGRRVATVSNMNRAKSAARSASRALKEKGDVASAEAALAAVDEQIETLGAQFDAEVKELEAAVDPSALELSAVEVKPRKGDITLGTVALVWVPWGEKGPL